MGVNVIGRLRLSTLPFAVGTAAMFTTRHWAQLPAEQFVNLGGHDEITFGQAVDLVCP